MFGENNEPQINFDSIQAVPDSKRRLQLIFALALLVTALVLVVMKNRQFWLDTLNFEDILGQATSETVNEFPLARCLLQMPIFRYVLQIDGLLRPRIERHFVAELSEDTRITRNLNKRTARTMIREKFSL